MKNDLPRTLRQERRWIAQRLHDTICQELTGIGLMVGAMANQRRSTCPETERQLQEIAALVKHAGAALGKLVLDLHGKD